MWFLQVKESLDLIANSQSETETEEMCSVSGVVKEVKKKSKYNLRNSSHDSYHYDESNDETVRLFQNLIFIILSVFYVMICNISQCKIV